MSVHRSAGAADTERIAGELATQLRRGDVVLVTGELGAGKTTFVRGACRALGVREPVVSPTFTIGRRYQASGGLVIAHLDLYRLETLDGEDPGLIDDYVTPASVAFLEWPEVAEGKLDAPAARVSIEHAGKDMRRLRITRAGDAQ